MDAEILNGALIVCPDWELMSLYVTRQAAAWHNDIARCSLGRDRDLQLAGTKAATATAI